MTTIVTPDFQYAAQYYPEVLEILIQAMRTNVPEITDEDEAEPYIQMLRSVALGSHLNTVLLDLVAKEGYLASAKLRASVKRLLELIDYHLAQASPATSDLVIKLNGTVTATTQVTVPTAQFSTSSTADTPAIPYEDIDGHSTERTDQVKGCLAYDKTGDAWTDHTTAANTSSSLFAVGWGAAPEAGDLLYVIHNDVQWDSLKFNINVAAANITGVFEYFDNRTRVENPSSVTNLGSNLRLKINTLLGTSERTGAVVRVTCNVTGVFEDLTSAWDSTDNYVDTTAFLGQISPSTTASDYIVAAEWLEPENVVDNTSDFTVTGDQTVEFTLPQDRYRDWQSTTVNSVVGYPMRYRIISVGGSPTTPTLDTVDIDDDGLYLVIEVVQGVTRKDDPLGSSTGLADQRFILVSYPVIDDTSLKIYVDEGSGDVEYHRQSNLLSSTSVDRHFVVEFDDDGKAEIIFGNGVNGKIPPAGSDNISADYRTMNEINGNVGVSAINQNQSGSGFIALVWNPRPASGYQPREGADDTSLSLAKQAGPASLRTGATAASPEEVETLTIAYQDADGSRPFTRCLAIEEGFGVKTIEAVLVAAGGVAATTTQIDDLEAYFNSDTAQKQYGVLVANHQVVGTNFVPKVINVTATVYGGNQTSIETALTALLDPEAKDADGNWQWDFGEEVPLSIIIATMHDTDPAPRKVTLTVPAADVSLVTRELPKVGTLSITVLP